MKIMVKSWEKLLEVGEYDGGDIYHTEDTKFVSHMRKYCEQIVEVKEYGQYCDGDYNCQTLDGEWLFASWMYEEVNLMNRNGANT